MNIVDFGHNLIFFNNLSLHQIYYLVFNYVLKFLKWVFLSGNFELFIETMKVFCVILDFEI